MDQDRSLDIQRVTKAMDANRQSIRETLDELKDRVQESADWRTWVAARPITSLAVAAACGVALARFLVPAGRLVRLPFLLSPKLMHRARRTGPAATWSRLAGAAGLLGEIAALASHIRGLVRPLDRSRRH